MLKDKTFQFEASLAGQAHRPAAWIAPCPCSERYDLLGGLGFRVYGLGFRVWGLGFRV